MAGDEYDAARATMKLARYTATAFLVGALAVGLGGASAAAGGNELQRPSVAKARKAASHNAERCPLERRHMYIEAPARQDL